MKCARVQDLVVTSESIISMDTSLPSIQRICRRADISLLFVIDQDQKVCGSIDRQAFAASLMSGKISTEATAENRLIRKANPLFLSLFLSFLRIP